MDNVAIYGEQIAGRAASVRKTLNALNKNIEHTLFDCAELLYEAQSNHYFSQWGFKNLSEYARQELHMKPRRAQYLSRIVYVCRTVGLKREDYDKVSVSKLREIATLEPEQTWFNPETRKNEPLYDAVLDLIVEANNLTLDQVKKVVALHKGQVGPDRRVLRTYSTNESAWDNIIKPAMELTRRRLGSAGRDDAGNAKEYHDGAIIEMWAAEVLADPHYREKEPVPEEKSENYYTPIPEENVEI